MNNFLNLNKNETTALKGIAILFVLFGHLGYIYAAGAWGVNLFLILSGYGIAKSNKTQIKENFFKDKIKKIYFPYVLMTFVVLLFYIIFNFNFIDIKTIIFSILGLDFGFLYDKTMWYISFIFVQYVLFYLSLKISKLTQNKQDFVLITTNLIFAFLLHIISRKYSIWNPGAGAYLYSYAFTIGIILSKLSEINIDLKAKRLSVMCIFALIIPTVVLYGNVHSILQYMIYAMAMPLACFLIMSLKKSDNNALFTFLGKYSFSIYLWEGFLLILYNNMVPESQHLIITDLVYIIITLLISYLYQKYII